jgi:hypothetical protein
MTDGWCPWAIRCDGPEIKRGYKDAAGNRILLTHAKVGVVLHTAEYESTPEWNDYTTLHNALFSDREASWTFTICRFMNGALLFQHYPIGTVCWAQGYQGNLWLDSIEHEGIAPEKLSGPQYELLVKTLRWIKEAHGWQKWTGIGTKGTVLGWHTVDGLSAGILFEHNAVPGAPATNCQVFTRGMIDPVQLLADLKEEEMKPPLFRIEGKPEVYYAAGGRLFHIPDQATFIALGYKNDDVTVLSANSPIWNLPVDYRLGVPDELR